MTSSRCNTAKSGFCKKTFFLWRKSAEGSVPGMMGVARNPSLEVEAALEIEGWEEMSPGLGKGATGASAVCATPPPPYVESGYKHVM